MHTASKEPCSHYAEWRARLHDCNAVKSGSRQTSPQVKEIRDAWMGLGPAWKGGGASGEGCRGNVPESQGFNKKKSFLTGLEAGDLRSRCPGSAWGLPPWLADGCLLATFSPTSPMSLFLGAHQSPGTSALPFYPPPESRLQMQPRWRSALQHMNLKGHNVSHNNPLTENNCKNAEGNFFVKCFHLLMIWKVRNTQESKAKGRTI